MLLLDTHVALWFVYDPSKIPAKVLSLICNEVSCVSAASVWEVAIKHSIGKLAVPAKTFLKDLSSSGFQLLDITAEDAITTESLPLLHRDPFDRVIVAQAINRSLQLVTADVTVARYPCAIVTL